MQIVHRHEVVSGAAMETAHFGPYRAGRVICWNYLYLSQKLEEITDLITMRRSGKRVRVRCGTRAAAIRRSQQASLTSTLRRFG